MANKVLFLVTQIGGIGGIQRFNRNFLDALNDNDCNVDIVSLHDDFSSLDSLERNNSNTFIPCNHSKTMLCLKLLRLLIEKKYDKYICGHINLAPIMALYKLFIRNIKSNDYLILHGVEVWGRVNFLKMVSTQSIYKTLSVSKYTKDDYLSQVRTIDSEKILIFPNTIGKSHQPQTTINKKPFNSNNKFIILTVSRLDTTEREKGIADVISSLALLPEDMNYEYRIIGDGGDRNRLEELARSTGVAEKVIFLGAVSDAEMWEQYQIADVFILTSKKEGFGIVFLEAMSYKLPVIGASEKGILDVIMGNKNGLLVQYGSAREISDNITRLYKEPAMRKMMAEAGYAMVTNQGIFSYDSFKGRLKNYLGI